MNNAAATDHNDHPFQCNGCNACYRSHRFAARCCEQSSTDLRDGAVRGFDRLFEAMSALADDARWEKELAACRYECSCGERFREVDHAIRCRKCRTYTEAGWCTEVLDIRLDGKVMWTIAA